MGKKRKRKKRLLNWDMLGSSEGGNLASWCGRGGVKAIVIREGRRRAVSQKQSRREITNVKLAAASGSEIKVCGEKEVVFRGSGRKRVNAIVD